MIDQIRGFLRQRRAKKWLARPATQTPHGFMFGGPKAMETGVFEAEETAFLSALFASADMFVNIGANFGYYVCMANSAGVRAVAIEPVPLNAQLLQRNLAANGFETLTTVHRCACGAKEDQVEIFGVGTGASLVSGWARNPSSLSTQVQVRRLDDVLKDVTLSQHSVFLCDVEGFELEALRGAQAILAHPAKPTWMIETGLTDLRDDTALNPNFLPLFDLVTGHGYLLYALAERRQPITRAMIERSLAAGVDHIGGINFVLAPPGRDVSLLPNEG